MIAKDKHMILSFIGAVLSILALVSSPQASAEGRILLVSVSNHGRCSSCKIAILFIHTAGPFAEYPAEGPCICINHSHRDAQ